MANPIRHRKEVEELAKILDEKRLTEIEYEAGGLRIRVARSGAPVAPAATVAPEPGATVISGGSAKAADAGQVETDEQAGITVRSPMVGTFYVAASPDSPPFVGVGDRVRKGQVICIIEAMKLMNEIECEHDGVVTEILVENAEGVEFEQPLFRISDD